MKTEVSPPGPPVCTTLTAGHRAQRVRNGAALLALDLGSRDHRDGAGDVSLGVGMPVGLITNGTLDAGVVTAVGVVTVVVQWSPAGGRALARAVAGRGAVSAG